MQTYNRKLADSLVTFFRKYLTELRLSEKNDTRDKGTKDSFTKSINKLEQLTNELEITGILK